MLGEHWEAVGGLRPLTHLEGSESLGGEDSVLGMPIKACLPEITLVFLSSAWSHWEVSACASSSPTHLPLPQ